MHLFLSPFTMIDTASVAYVFFGVIRWSAIETYLYGRYVSFLVATSSNPAACAAYGPRSVLSPPLLP